MLETLGLLRNYQAGVDECVSVVLAQNEHLRPESAAIRNSAKRYARQCIDRLPIFLGAGASVPQVRQWKTMKITKDKHLAGTEAMPAARLNLIADL